MDQWILDGKTPKRCNDLREWGEWRRSTDRRIARDEINGVTISTVFLGIDHGFGYGAPVLFETMVFGGELDQEQERYTTYEAAEAGHAAMVARVKETENWPQEV
jgi:hypothetical protein